MQALVIPPPAGGAASRVSTEVEVDERLIIKVLLLKSGIAIEG
jgi:hypothetical protein